MSKLNVVAGRTATRKALVLLVGVAGAALAFSDAASAQEAGGSEIADNAAGAQGGEIVVTGSRIARRDLVSNSPIMTTNEEALENTGSVEIEQSLLRLPQFTPGGTQFQTGLLSGGNLGQGALNLRGLGSARNLVLLDGRRAQPAAANLQIDVSSIPSSLLESVEVITGGASAVYGSDAIAGVTNFKLKRKFVGFEISSQIGITGRGDGRTIDVSATAGTEFGGGRGNIMVAGSFYDRESISTNQRSYFGRQAAARQGGSAIIPQGVYQSGIGGPIGPGDLVPPYFLPFGNRPTSAAITSLFAGKYGIAGTVPNTVNISFNPDGTLFTQSNGIRNYRGPGAGNGYYVSALTGQLVYNSDADSNQLFSTELRRYSGFARLNYELTDNLNFFAQGLYTSTETKLQIPLTLAGFNIWDLVVPVSNPFIPADLQPILASRPQPNANFTITKGLTVFGPRSQRPKTDTFQVVAGLNGKFGDSISWEIYGSHGETKIDAPIDGAVSYKALERLLFAADGGNSLCAGGFNPFGNNAVSDACVAFAARTAKSKSTLTQDVVEASLQGGLFTLPAGEVRFAAGAGYRRNGYSFRNDAALENSLPTADLIALSPGDATDAKTEVAEVFGELFVPILKDVPLIQELSVSAAYRYSDYDATGGAHTYKADLSWQVVDALRIRGGYQRAIRAPNIGELYGGTVANPPLIGFTAQRQGDPCDINSTFRAAGNASAAQVRTLCIAQGVPTAQVDSFVFPVPQVGGSTVSNSSLTPEKADTFTVGAVFDPAMSGLFRNFSLTVDYYNIELRNAISYIPAVTSLRNCFNELGSNPNFDPSNLFCRQITRSAGGQIVALDTRPVNSGGIKTDGIDFQLNWRFDLAESDSSLSFDVAGSYINSFKISSLDGLPFLEYAGTVNGPLGPQAKWRVNTTVSYGSKSANIGLRWNFLNRMRSQTSVTTPSAELPGVASYSTFDLFGRVKVDDRFELYGGVNNIADKKPLDVDGLAGETNTSLYDPLGRRFYLGAKARF